MDRCIHLSGAKIQFKKKKKNGWSKSNSELRNKAKRPVGTPAYLFSSCSSLYLRLKNDNALLSNVAKNKTPHRYFKKLENGNKNAVHFAQFSVRSIFFFFYKFLMIQRVPKY